MQQLSLHDLLTFNDTWSACFRVGRPAWLMTELRHVSRGRKLMRAAPPLRADPERTLEVVREAVELSALPALRFMYDEGAGFDIDLWSGTPARLQQAVP